MAAPRFVIPGMVAVVLVALGLAFVRAPIAAHAQEDGVQSEGAQAERGVPTDVMETHGIGTTSERPT
jgi:hypothetical protein